MSSNTDIEPIVLHGVVGPNPPKVLMLLRELGLPHKPVPVDFSELKKPDFLAINPNGRMPAIEDPNTGLTLWESGAILQYLVDRYDTDNKLSFTPGTNEHALASQWLFFQVSGQGPYYGQFVWFTRYHPEKVPSARERYANEIKRVTGVLEGHLKQQPEGRRWIVGGRFSYVDIAFLPWQVVAKYAAKEFYDDADFPHVKAWTEAMLARPIIKEAMANLGGEKPS